MLFAGGRSSAEMKECAATTETTVLLQTTSSVVQHTPVSPLPELTSFATVTLSSKSDISTSSTSSVVADLSVIANLLPNTESKWSRWSPWSDCTQTCGSGTRHRNRTCVAINDKAVFAPISCAGKSNQMKSCAEWKCPVAPFVTVHPESKVRMPGQSVTFCCEGEGNPQPEIEWFKENNVIDKSFYNHNNTLEINDVQGLNGSYRCRAINQFGSEFSNEADLKVLENSEDSCSSMPSSNNVTLPPGCFVNGTNSTTVDVGECEPIACVMRGVNYSSSCSDPPLCCGPLFTESVLVKCGFAISFGLSVIKGCGCGKCFEKETFISGVVIGPDGSPATFVDLVFKGKSVGSTDTDGKFSFPVPKTTRRAVVTFKDQMNNKFVEEDKLFVVEEGQTAVYTVKLREKPAPVIFNASEPLDVPLGSDSSDSFADLELPENALLTEDGSIFSGNAKATVSVTDPRNQSDIESAPGDFSSMNEDGEEELLQTFGMIKVNLEDDNGKQLTMSKPMKVYLDPEKLNLTVSGGIRLYWLDKKTGRWREAGKFLLEDGKNRRRKRSGRTFLAVNVTPSLAKHDLNFDTPSERVALRVTITKDTTNDNYASDKVLVRVICLNPNGYMEKVTVNRLACVVILRNADCYVQALNLRENIFYEPYPNSIETKDIFKNVGGSIVSSKGKGTTIKSFRFNSILNGSDGPTYSVNSAGEEKCTVSLNSALAPQTKTAQFVFKIPESISSYNLLRRVNNWPEESDKSKCFVRVVHEGKKAIFMASGYKGKNFGDGELYGYHVKSSEPETPGSSKQVVCLQFRCPPENTRNKAVFLLVTPLSTTKNIDIKFNEMNSRLKVVDIFPECSGITHPNNALGKRFCAPYWLKALFTFKDSTRCFQERNSTHLTFQ
ncbi:Cartilage intermediate layer protein 1 [Stylophora pistillata]|uniref:Cartilage intermediate layer protein 1 n=1 Tax=Stylophora pistillata TaxID=50429 RepID=A0A2B4RX74_STYPI|nr:Cartilage intermediate layer protein 1 [Stylophora pistillata]